MPVVRSTASRDSMQYEIAPITRFGGAQLREVQQQEVICWREKLTWDFVPSAALVSAAIDQRLLGGNVLLVGARPVGYCYYVKAATRAAVGSFFYLRDAVGSCPVEELVRSTIGEILADRHVLRVEAQLPCGDPEILADVLAEMSFAAYPRLYMMRALAGEMELPVDGDQVVRGWTQADIAPAANLLFEAYRGQIDEVVHVQYTSQQGCYEFLEDLMRHPGCGHFDPAISVAGCDPGTGRLSGFVLGTRVARGNAHVPQVAVHPAFWGRGIGRLLMASFFARSASLGYDVASLNVTQANTRAVGLYRSLGMHETQRFNAFVYQR